MPNLHAPIRGHTPAYAFPFGYLLPNNNLGKRPKAPLNVTHTNNNSPARATEHTFAQNAQPINKPSSQISASNSEAKFSVKVQDSIAHFERTAHATADNAVVIDVKAGTPEKIERATLKTRAEQGEIADSDSDSDSDSEETAPSNADKNVVIDVTADTPVKVGPSILKPTPPIPSRLKRVWEALTACFRHTSSKPPPNNNARHTRHVRFDSTRNEIRFLSAW
jgi:hypothetical protein